MRKNWALACALLTVTWLPTAQAAHAQPAGHFYGETAFGITDARIASYFDSRGGVQTFGFPVSNESTLLGFPVQIFQRHVLQVSEDGVRPINLLDPDVLPVTSINFSTFPAHDPAVATAAPGPSTPNYAAAILAYIRDSVPDTWQDQPVGFQTAYLAAAPPDSGDAAPIVALEVWGFPTSNPAYDPKNGAFVYQRFQRGFLQYDATTGFTGAILLGDAFKGVLQGNPNPPDLAQQARTSRFWNQYDRNKPGWLARPNELPATDLTNAFEKPIQIGSPDYGASIFVWGFPGTTARDLAKLTSAGLGWQKTLFQWRYLEPQRGKFDWTEADRIVKASNAAGVNVVARIDFQPTWARADATVGNGSPDNPQDFADFIGAFAGRYKPGSPNGTVAAIQLWNEPNLAREWGDEALGAQSAGEYVGLLCAGYQALKQASPSTIAVSAGLSPTGVVDAGARDDVVYLREMYAAGASGCFDALGAQGNTQAPDPTMDIGTWRGCDGGASLCTDGSFYFRRIEQLRSAMVAAGDANKQVWLLEFGWTSDPIHPDYSWYGVSEDQKAQNIVTAYRFAYDQWRPWIGPMILWTLSSPAWDPSQEEYWWAVTNRTAQTALPTMR